MEREEYRYLFELEDRLWWFIAMRAITRAVLERFLPRGRPLRILDAGCGTAGMLPVLRRYGCACGIDFSPEAIGFARGRGELKLARASITALPFPTGSFDLVTEFEVVNHWAIRDDQAAFNELARVLRPGGLLHFREPAHQWLFAKHDLAVHTRQRYSRRELKAKLIQAGFEPVYLGYANCILFPVALVRRLVGNLLPGGQGSDVRDIPRPLNWFLTRVMSLEASWVKRGRLPIGLSHLIVARRLCT
jgi:SAM-dependent methyltransferase